MRLDPQPLLSLNWDDAPGIEPSFVLTQLEVFNWGPFRGFHRAQFDSCGTAIIGPTGSGKTTLVDGLMTLLVEKPRYNLASTGGFESDRTLISYVRGVLSGDGSEGREEVSRPGKTITGICATYQAGQQTLRLGGLLWTEGTSNAADDLKRRWFFSLALDQSLEQWLRLLNDDGIRDLMRAGRETANLRIFDSKRAYLAHVRKFFDVRENAFTLLNRAAGLKQLHSIDEIFRDLVLDDNSAFERAIEVAKEFDNLAEIHAELETARRQQESLVPVAEEYERLLKLKRKAERYGTLKRILPVWLAIVSKNKWTQFLKELNAERDTLNSELIQAKTQEEACRAAVDTLRERYLQLGGNRVDELEKTIALQEKLTQEIKNHAVLYQSLVKQFALSDQLTAESLSRNQESLRSKRDELQTQRSGQWDATVDANSRMRESEVKLTEIETMLRKVKERPGSNIPPQFQDFRSELAGQLSLGESDLPFLAELIEVKSDQSDWRGAIERAIGSERLRVLVPAVNLEAALRWVNHRDNRLHVRLQSAEQDAEPAKFFDDGYTRKLNFKKHPLIGTAKRLLAGRDLHCVASAEALKRTEHALTIQGMMSGRGGKFEKQDQRRLDQDWMTGFDNKDQLDALAAQMKELAASVAKLKADSDKQRETLSKLDQNLQTIDSILELEFSKIDLPKAEAELSQSYHRRDALLDPKSDACLAKNAFEAENRIWESHRTAISEIEREITTRDVKIRQADQECEKAKARIGKGLSDEETSLAQTNIQIASNVAPQRMDEEERKWNAIVETKLSEQLAKVGDSEKSLIRNMGNAKQVDTGALAETPAAVEEVQVFLEQFRVLNEEALPEKRGRFLEYLNRSSDQGVTQLLAGIQEEVDAIEQRLKELNQTLVKVDYRTDRYLQLQPRKISDERLRALEAAMRKVRGAALKDDGGESHYKALQEMIKILREAGENRTRQGSKALLDPRFRLQFFVVEVDRKTGDRSPPRTGSQSGSGGEKELMASHILTASLSYALCPPEASRPLYSTVVLDEAFSKSSPSAANRIIEALRIFCLHPVFVTPNKEIGLLKQHTRKVICVQRLGKEASLASISWEKLEELANTR